MPPIKSTQRWAFSLVEVVTALGIAAFAIIPMLGLLAIGLNTARETSVETAVATIGQQLRGELQQISFDSSDSFNIQSLGQTVYYYDQSGIRTKADKAFFQAKFAPVAGMACGTTITPSHGQTIRITIDYPMDAPEANRQQIVLSLFAARQFKG